MAGTIHSEPHALAGKTVSVKFDRPHRQFGETAEIEIEDYWDRVAGISWMDANGNPSCLIYAMRSAAPIDNEVLYGKVNRSGVLVHVSEVTP